MLSVNLIQRLFETRRFEQLLEAVASNGLELPLPLRARLAQTNIAPIALGLRRVADLTYGPTTLSRAMTDTLVASSRSQLGEPTDPLTAATLAAAFAVAADHDPEAQQARYDAVAALAAMQGEDGLFHFADDRSEQDRALVAAFVLFLLAGDEAFRLHVRMADLLDYFDQHHEHLDRPTERLWRMARAEVTTDLIDQLTLAA